MSATALSVHIETSSRSARSATRIAPAKPNFSWRIWSSWRRRTAWSRPSARARVFDATFAIFVVQVKWPVDDVDAAADEDTEVVYSWLEQWQGYPVRRKQPHEDVAPRKCAKPSA
ncbi:Aste57867_17686 [Aphanomyces stellatus]|uniref:Aste57867_17686 protein n=1 Tax=Aphanomyces stellatus TaxID=120398 RepID=A0A485L9Y9_9STRA|nr:hypothetical protein As57867_017625 [Aphanomyces stellatus]VFT94436.1 Aste57867_17686 [Aphanomyces stellatus]